MIRIAVRREPSFTGPLLVESMGAARGKPREGLGEVQRILLAT
jgi:hypothetical protein